MITLLLRSFLIAQEVLQQILFTHYTAFDYFFPRLCAAQRFSITAETRIPTESSSDWLHMPASATQKTVKASPGIELLCLNALTVACFENKALRSNLLRALSHITPKNTLHRELQLRERTAPNQWSLVTASTHRLANTATAWTFQTHVWYPMYILALIIFWYPW